MTEQEIIKAFCSIQALAYYSIGDYSKPADGFCHECKALGKALGLPNFQNHGQVVTFIRQAVVNELKAQGYGINYQFDQETGEEK